MRLHKGVNQARFSVGLPTVKRDNPDIYALEVMNEILGGSDFTSRITKRVRSDEGLAYSAGSALSFGVFFPGRFRAAFQSKNRTVAYAASLVMEEIRRIREELVTAAELETIRNSLVQTLPPNFASRAQAMGIFASDEYMLAVGDQKEIDLGDLSRGVSMASLAPGGRVTTLALPDPLTPRRP